MTRKRTIRRHYRTDVNPVLIALEGACITSQQKLDKLRIRELSAIEAFAKGTATPNDWRDIADYCNLCGTLVEMGIDGEGISEAVEACEAALIAAVERKDRIGKLGFSGPELEAVRTVYAWQDAQRTSVDLRTYEEAIRRTANKIRSGHPSLKVVA